MRYLSQTASFVAGAAVVLAGFGIHSVITDPGSYRVKTSFDRDVEYAWSHPAPHPRTMYTTFEQDYAIMNMPEYDFGGRVPWVGVPAGAKVTEIGPLSQEDGRILSCYNSFGDAPVRDCANGIAILVDPADTSSERPAPMPHP